MRLVCIVLDSFSFAPLFNFSLQDMEKIRQGHMEMLADVRENYQSELARTKAELERSLADVRQADSVDFNRVKENFTIRYGYFSFT